MQNVYKNYLFFIKIIFCFLNFSQLFLNDQCTGGSEKQQISQSLALDQH